MKTIIVAIWKIVSPSLCPSSRFGQGVIWNIVGALFTQGSVFLTTIILARLLGKDQFGEFGMIQSTLLTLTSIAQVATGITATKFVAEFRDVDKVHAGRMLGLCSILTFATGTLGTTFLIISAPWLADHVLKAPQLSSGLLLSAAFVLFSVMTGYQIGALAGLEAYKCISLFGAMLGTAHILICLGATVLWGLNGGLAGLAISALLRWGVYAAVLRREVSRQGISLRRREGIRERKRVFEFALPAALSGMTALPAVWLANALLVRQPNGYSEMGIYTAVNNLRVIVLFLPVLLNGVSYSILNNLKGKGNLDGYRTTFSFNLRTATFSAIVGAALMCTLGPWAMQVFGKDFAGASVAPIIFLVAASVVLEAAGNAAYQLIICNGLMWVSLCAVALPRDFSLIIAAYYLIPVHGAAGLAGAYTFSCLLSLVTVFAINGKMSLYDRI
jgi:O-antigen/teichoic acid export membrane protein